MREGARGCRGHCDMRAVALLARLRGPVPLLLQALSSFCFCWKGIPHYAADGGGGRSVKCCVQAVVAEQGKAGGKGGEGEGCKNENLKEEEREGGGRCVQ